MASVHGIKVYQYNLDGSFLAEYQKITEAEFITGINNITLVINNKRNMFSAGGYFWTTKYYLKIPQDLIDKYNDRNFEKYDIPIYEYDMDGNLINEYSSLSKITKIRKNRNNIRSILKGEIKTFNNKIYKFEKYKKLPKSILKNHINKWSGRIIQYSLKMKKIKEWSSTYEAATNLKMSRSNITRCLKGQQEQANGFIWKYDK